MTAASHAETHGAHGAHDTHHGNYVATWGILLVLLVVSVVGPMLGNQWITLATAFGVAGVKAFLVVTRFMHMTHAPKIIGYIIGTCVVFMFLLFGAVSPDVMRHKGENWVNKAANDETARALAAQKDAAAHGGGEHH